MRLNTGGWGGGGGGVHQVCQQTLRNCALTQSVSEVTHAKLHNYLCVSGITSLDEHTYGGYHNNFWCLSPSGLELSARTAPPESLCDSRFPFGERAHAATTRHSPRTHTSQHEHVHASWGSWTTPKPGNDALTTPQSAISIKRAAQKLFNYFQSESVLVRLTRFFRFQKWPYMKTPYTADTKDKGSWRKSKMCMYVPIPVKVEELLNALSLENYSKLKK